MKVTVFGSARLGEATAEYQDAVRLGTLLAQAGHTVMSGGYGGLMEAVSRGAHEAGGDVVGITMAAWDGRLVPNRYLSRQLAAETLFARIEQLIKADSLIALPGGAGTLGEVALAWNLLQMKLIPPTPVILVGSGWATMVEAFRSNLIVNEHDLAMLRVVAGVDEAVAAVGSASIEPAVDTAFRG